MADLRFGALVLALLIYGFFGSPTPDVFSYAEVFVGGLLCVAALPGAWFFVRSWQSARGFWRMSGFVLMVYGLSIPLLLAAVYGQSSAWVVRDIIPFLFIGLPLFMADLFHHQPKRFQILLRVVFVVGIVQAARSLLPSYSLPILAFIQPDAFSYLANSPFVLLSLLLCVAGLFRAFQYERFVLFIVFAGLAVMPLLAMGITLQRASLGYAALFSVLLLGLLTWNRPRRALGIWIFVGALVGIFSHDILQLFEALWHKTQIHGFNQRAEEWHAVWDAASQSWVRIVFGQGWGAGFHSPATDGVWVNFTHSLFSSFLLKAGIAGLCLITAYLAGLFHVLWREVRHAQLFVLIVSGPFLVDVFVYATFKSLDFGMLLLLIPAGIASKGASFLETRTILR